MNESDADREKKCAALVERIWTLITRGEGAYGTSVYFYDVLLLLLGREVSHCRIEITIDSFEGVPSNIADKIIKFFYDHVRDPIRAFQKDQAEGDDLFIQLLRSAEDPLAVAHRAAARKQKREMLQQAAQTPTNEQQK